MISDSFQEFEENLWVGSLHEQQPKLQFGTGRYFGMKISDVKSNFTLKVVVRAC